MGKLWNAVERVLTGATAEERVALQNALADQRADARMAALVDDLEAHFDEDVAAERAMANMTSLEDVPAAVLPFACPARTALIWLMSSGQNVYAYASGGPTTGTWCVWIDPLATARFGGQGRVTLAEWCEHWPELLAEMGLAMPGAEAEAAEGRVSA